MATVSLQQTVPKCALVGVVKENILKIYFQIIDLLLD